MGKLEAVDFSLDPNKRYTFWSGILGGFFLSLSYFGADQSQVQRYLAGGSLRASRFGLIFNAIVKVPMQFLILLLGVMVFLFYQFEKPPIFFNQPTYQRAIEHGHGHELNALQAQFDDVFARKRDAIQAMSAASAADATGPDRASAASRCPEPRHSRPHQEILVQAGANPKSKDSDYVFITFVLQHLPHGVVGLADRGHFLRHDVGDFRGPERAGLNDSRRFLSTAHPAEGERPPLRRRDQMADAGVGPCGHRRRLVRKPGREPDRSRQHSRLDLLRQCSRACFWSRFSCELCAARPFSSRRLIAQTLVLVLFLPRASAIFGTTSSAAAAVVIIALFSADRRCSRRTARSRFD